MNTITQDEINALLSHKDCEIAHLITRYNNKIKCVHLDSQKQFYVWCEKSKLYVRNDKKNRRLKLAIFNVLQRIINCVSKIKELTEQTIARILNIYANAVKIANIMLLLDIRPDQRFKDLLDKHPYHFAIKYGHKIDIRTRRITSRTMHDYFTIQLDHTYVRDLHCANNLFVRFIKTLFPEHIEYTFIQYLFGYLLSLRVSEKLIVVFSDPKGGGGKTLLMHTIQQIFTNYVVAISKRSILHGSVDVNTELRKLQDKRIAYIEALDRETNQKNVEHKLLVLDKLLGITGGGIRQDPDNYNGSEETNINKLNAKLILLGNDECISNVTDIALNRRIIYIPMQYYFRSKHHDDYREEDPLCLEIDPTITSTLANNLDHAFTWLIDCMHVYFYEQPEILKIVPQRFTEAWNKSVTKNSKHIYWSVFVHNNIIQTIDEVETLTDVCQAINNSIMNASIECYTHQNIIDELKQQTIMKLIYCHKGKIGQYILNCKLKRNNSILSNWNN